MNTSNSNRQLAARFLIRLGCARRRLAGGRNQMPEARCDQPETGHMKSNELGEGSWCSERAALTSDFDHFCLVCRKFCDGFMLVCV